MPDISREEMTRAIYLDYECSQGRPPVLLGILVDRHLSQFIVDPAFATCAGRWGASKVRNERHAQFLRSLVARAIADNRVIISWSKFDFDHVLAAAPELQPAMVERFRNAIPTARHWRHEHHPGMTGGNRLLLYADLTKFEIPERFRGRVVGRPLSLIRGQLEAGRTYNQLTPAARRGWRTIVRHNQYDLLAMKHILREICS